MNISRRELDRRERARHDDELGDEAARRIDELRQGNATKNRMPFGLVSAESAPWRKSDPTSALGRSARAVVKVDRRRAPDLDAEPDKVGAAHPFQHREPDQRRREKRPDAEHRETDDGDEPDHSSGHSEEGLTTSVKHAVREGEQAVGTRRQRQADGRESA